MSVMPPMPCIQRFPEMQIDRETLLPGLAAYALQRTELPRGVRLRFTATAERLRQIEAVARREQEYCAALEFRVGLSLGNASLTLDVTGPAGTESFLAELLDAPMAA